MISNTTINSSARRCHAPRRARFTQQCVLHHVASPHHRRKNLGNFFGVGISTYRNIDISLYSKIATISDILHYTIGRWSHAPRRAGSAEQSVPHRVAPPRHRRKTIGNSFVRRHEALRSCVLFFEVQNRKGVNGIRGSDGHRTRIDL